MRALWAILLAMATALGCRGAGMDVDSVMRVLSELPLHEVEGLWQLTDDAATVVIWRSDRLSDRPRSYDMVLVQTADRLQPGGMLLGTLTPTAQPRMFDARIFTSTDRHGRPSKPKRFTLKLEDEAHLSFTRVNSGLRVSPLVLFPHVFRRGIRIEDNRRRDLDGCIKIYPRVPIKGVPRYL